MRNERRDEPHQHRLPHEAPSGFHSVDGFATITTYSNKSEAGQH